MEISMSQSSGESDLRQTQSEAMRLVDAGDFQAAFLLVESGGDPVHISASYNDFAQALYNQRKDVTEMLAVARRGVSYSLEAAERVGSSDAGRAATLKENVKIIAYNAAANSWPGWGDEGVVIEPRHLVEGSDLADQAFRLVEELELGNKQLGNGQCLIGALHMAAGRGAAADAAFQRAQEANRAAGAQAPELMVEGYRALLRKRFPEIHPQGALDFEEVSRRLEQNGSKEALFFLQQLKTADQLL
jgi:hypothetical protein